MPGSSWLRAVDELGVEARGPASCVGAGHAAPSWSCTCVCALQLDVSHNWLAPQLIPSPSVARCRAKVSPMRVHVLQVGYGDDEPVRRPDRRGWPTWSATSAGPTSSCCRSCGRTAVSATALGRAGRAGRRARRWRRWPRPPGTPGPSCTRQHRRAAPGARPRAAGSRPVEHLGAVRPGRRPARHLPQDPPVRVRRGEPALLEAGERRGRRRLRLGGREPSLGLATCYDLRFPELFRRLLDAGARAGTAARPPGRRPGSRRWTLLGRARAIEDQVSSCSATPRDARGRPHGRPQPGGRRHRARPRRGRRRRGGPGGRRRPGRGRRLARALPRLADRRL